MPTTPAMPPLPEIEPEGEPEPDETLPLDGPGALLSLPLQGAQARQEWLDIGEMREAQADNALQSEAARTGKRTLILAGQGSYLGVENGALVAHSGRSHGAPAPERELFWPGMHAVERIIWIGAHGYHTGTLTIAAAAWCQREGIHLLVLDGALSSMPLLEGAPLDYPMHAELRRRQWLLSSGLALPDSMPASQIVYEIVRRKLAGQYRTLQAHPELPGQVRCLVLFDEWHQWLSLSNPPTWLRSVAYLRKLEGRLAAGYFRSWEGWSLKWAKPDIRRLPPHWLTARSRHSPLSSWGSGRHAVDPLNACLNYCYACLASQCRQALLTEGFDLACGFLHMDKPGRDSLTYDLMELERGAVDDLLLSFLAHTTLHYGDFARASDGSLMLHPQMTRLLLAQCRVAQSRVDGHARWLKRLILPDTKRDDTPTRDPDNAGPV